MASVVALVSDMIFASRIRAISAQLGVSCTVVAKPTALESAIKESAPHTVLIDLQCDAADTVAAVEALVANETRPRIVGFCAHVATELMEQARAAGADLVLPRSAFVQQLNELLSGESGE